MVDYIRLAKFTSEFWNKTKGEKSKSACGVFRLVVMNDCLFKNSQRLQKKNPILNQIANFGVKSNQFTMKSNKFSET